MILHWRQPQLSHTVHLAVGSAHRALCGADVLTAHTDAEIPRHMACEACLREATTHGLQRPPFTQPSVPDTRTRRLF